MTIHSNTKTHVTSDKMWGALLERDITGEVIPDAVAITIASHYQSSGAIGMVFAQLASTGVCEYEPLRAAIKYETLLHADTAFEPVKLAALLEWADEAESR